MYVALACDRTGSVVSAPGPYRTRGGFGLANLEAALKGRIERADSPEPSEPPGSPESRESLDSLESLESPDPLNLTATLEARPAARPFAGRIGAIYHDAFLPPGRRPGWTRGRRRRTKVPPADRSLVHVRTVVSYIRRFRAWLKRFRGVATRYLPNYLLWHRLVDADVRNRFQSLLLRWARPPAT